MHRRVESGEHAHVRCGGRRIGRERVLEQDALCCEPIEIRRRLSIAAVSADEVGAQRVERDQEQIPARALRLRLQDARHGPDRKRDRNMARARRRLAASLELERDILAGEAGEIDAVTGPAFLALLHGAAALVQQDMGALPLARQDAKVDVRVRRAARRIAQTEAADEHRSLLDLQRLVLEPALRGRKGESFDVELDRAFGLVADLEVDGELAAARHADSGRKALPAARSLGLPHPHDDERDSAHLLSHPIGLAELAGAAYGVSSGSRQHPLRRLDRGPRLLRGCGDGGIDHGELRALALPCQDVLDLQGITRAASARVEPGDDRRGREKTDGTRGPAPHRGWT